MQKCFIAFGGREREPFLVGAVEPPVFVLVYDPSPVGKVQIVGKQLPEVFYKYPESVGILKCFHIFFAGHVIVKFISLINN